MRQAWSYFRNGSNRAVPKDKVIQDVDAAINERHCEFFFKRVQSEMIFIYIEGCLTKTALH